MSNDIISNCMLCGEHGLHLIGEGETQMSQCLNCGYMSTEQLKGIDNNEFFEKMGEGIKDWAKYTEDRIWIPVQMTLPVGALYPVDVKDKMKWAFAPMVDIPEEEQQKNPDTEQPLYNKKYDEKNPVLFDTFIDGFSYLNNLLKSSIDG